MDVHEDYVWTLAHVQARSNACCNSPYNVGSRRQVWGKTLVPFTGLFLAEACFLRFANFLFPDRYYGESQPICSKTSRTHSTMQYLTVSVSRVCSCFLFHTQLLLWEGECGLLSPLSSIWSRSAFPVLSLTLIKPNFLCVGRTSDGRLQRTCLGDQAQI